MALFPSRQVVVLGVQGGCNSKYALVRFRDRVAEVHLVGLLLQLHLLLLLLLTHLPFGTRHYHQLYKVVNMMRAEGSERT